MSIAKKIAKRILAYAPYRYVNIGQEFYQWRNKFEQMKEMTAEQIREAQWNALTETVKYAYENTDFYRHLYDEHGFHPSELKNESDLQRIPVINKMMVREGGQSLVSKQFDIRKLSTGATSGTTGTSLTLYYNRALEQREWAATCFLWSDVGYEPGEGRIELRGIVEGDQEYVVDRFHRVIRLNVSRLTAQNIHRMMKLILDSGYRYLHGYPSSLSLFAKLLSESGLNHNYRPDAILVASEMFHDHQEQAIRHVFPGAKLHVHYGQSERVIMAGRVERSAYHFLPLYGYVERNPGTGGIIGTSFINHVTPFIRYELSDTIPEFSHPADQPSYLFPSIPSIDGRVSEIMYKPNGDMVSSALLAIMVRGFKTITACQFVQRQYDEIDVIVESVLPEEVVMEEMQLLTRKLVELLTDAMNISIQKVERIPRTPAGKLKFVDVCIGTARGGG
ncbi:hypothetical protein [Paenibacillus guangzhouensis]|uniref:hypothetical protein n=1 Tax=Paenibacillus guangzhouensis TaxID=1473112 RepID=UPI0012676B0F|nr:hypothetical protein [Paenibacillus guangzhouensis]